MADRIPRTSEFAGVSAIGVAAVGILLWIADGWSIVASNEHVYPWQVKFGLLCAALAIQVLARDRPALGFALMLALVAWDLPFGPSVALWIALSDVIYLATALGSRRLADIVAWVSVLLTVVAAIVATVYGGVKGGVYATLVMVAVTWSPIGYARAVRAYRRLAHLERAEGESRRAAAITEERRRLARELHDTVAGHLSAVAILADAAQRSPGDPGVLKTIRSGSLAALEEMRSTINLLTSPDDAAVRTTLASLDPLIDIAQAAGGTVTVHGPGDTALPIAVEATTTRILGEAIANATKHAPGTPLEITLTIDGGELIVIATNPLPVGITTGSGNGLQNMAFRAESVGGDASAGPRGRDWVVRARIPMQVATP
ncbi:histidine kinase OS=Tsukamurella paurometabola (strain ATCC 8368 / DSM / CCUG 35730 / CIP 100753/ JCM 10117 / KCTC 9821 / NBRC 16120 / NCIMB 702349 / NCTC 13040) OX=521096 GN=Tpau_1875 PE=4 SV=1 [Tsukamurella paurometabola]|uniref:histidine kinase n=1 Tax=Tsukamurella paurometabola (strain ATCC 8368 / DSM 20162 / CCUG 35730 / CIP 100753 / JCM 10117 / KCTC 9821 / NBRC 16120 / NCIMB 702349 / NCTC 13040) TaxID=521096 RepID=D5UMZ1_TSUPD|nr:histidine kinase [Tsukamurella paurometabola]ADG78488.1 integral membrane sensor signal transduction histidine kinase [Tsukamurella paurometabola DSM 20162]SUP31873.1 Sensor protein vraS [Tsukamurella paurometabola]